MSAKRIIIFGFADSVHIHRWVAGLRTRGYEIKVISHGGAPIPDVETIIFPRTSKADYLWHSGSAIREAQAFKPDLVHVHYVGGFGLWSRRMNFCPTIASVWGSDLRIFSRSWAKRMLLRAALAQATVVTATSRFLIEQAREAFPDLEREYEFIPFGVELPNDIPPLPVGPTKICFTKHLEEVYAPDILIEAIAIVRQEVSDIRLSVAGKGKMLDRLQQLIAHHRLEEQVKLVGWVENDWIYHFIAEHNFMVMPSRAEAFGVAALEAAACGRPVIATSVGGIPEVVLNNLSGILVPPDDPVALAEAITKLSNDRSLQQQMGEAGQRYVLANYTWERSLDSMCALYERVIHEAGH